MAKPHQVFNSKKREVKKISFIVEKDDGGKETVEWDVKPLTPRLLVHNYKLFAGLEENAAKDPAKLTVEEQASMMSKLAPLIDVVLPSCCVNPQVVFEGESTESRINIDDMSLPALMSLFEEIFKVSGITEKAKEERKNLPKAPSDNQ